jgi:hypothetical protein
LRFVEIAIEMPFAIAPYGAEPGGFETLSVASASSKTPIMFGPSIDPDTINGQTKTSTAASDQAPTALGLQPEIKGALDKIKQFELRKFEGFFPSPLGDCVVTAEDRGCHPIPNGCEGSKISPCGRNDRGRA